MQKAASSMTANLVAIDKALHSALGLPPEQIVVLTNFKRALQRLGNVYYSDPLTTSARNAVSALKTKVTTVCFQWVPGHVGVQGNEKAERLAAVAHQEPTSFDPPTDTLKATHDVRIHIKNMKPQPSFPRGTL